MTNHQRHTIRCWAADIRDNKLATDDQVAKARLICNLLDILVKMEAANARALTETNIATLVGQLIISGVRGPA